MDLRPMPPQLYGATGDPDSFLTRLVNERGKTLANAHVSVSWGDRLLTLDKSAGFKEEAAFRAALGAIRVSHVYDQYYKQKEAEDDFMCVRGYEILELPTEQGLVVKR